MIGINNNLLSPQNLLLPSIHQVILVDSIFLPLIIARLLLKLVCLARCATWEYRAGIEVIISVRFLLVGSYELVGSLVANDHIGTVLLLLEGVWVVVRILLDRGNWAWYLIGLRRINHLLLLILVYLTGNFLIALSFIASLANFGIPAISALVHLFHLVLILLQGCLIIVDDYLFFGTSVTVGSWGVLAVSRLQVALPSSGPETLLLNLSWILTIPFLLLRVHLQILDMLLVGVLLIVRLGTLGGWISHSLDFSIVVLLLDFFESFVSDFSDERGICVRGVSHRSAQGWVRVLNTYYSWGNFCWVWSYLTWLRVLPNAHGIRRVINRNLTVVTRLKHLLIMRLLLLFDDGFIRLKILPNPLIDCLLAYLVVIRGLHLDHVL